MSSHDPTISMRQMLDHASEAVKMIRGRHADELAGDRMLELALTRLVEIVGEAAKRVPKAMQDKHAAVPWAKAIRSRDRLAHGYDFIDRAILWKTVEEDFPPLVEQLQKILGTRPPPVADRR